VAGTPDDQGQRSCDQSGANLREESRFGRSPEVALLDRTEIAADAGLRREPIFVHTAPGPSDSRDFHRLPTIGTLFDLRTVDIGLRGITEVPGSAGRRQSN
jgi:hypothetical protein